MNAEKGKLIAIEGIDGSGKTTIIKKIKENLERKGLEVVLIESGNNSSSIESQLKNIVISEKNNVSNITEILIYFAALSQKVDEIVIPSLNEGKIVLVDRFILSPLVFSTDMFHFNEKQTKTILNFSSHNLIPDLTILCDLDEKIAYSRMIKRNRELTKREKRGIKVQKDLRKGYLNKIKDYSKEYTILRTDKFNLDQIEKELKVLDQFLNE